MNKLPQEELLSAYLDGELTAEQKAHVDALLAADPSAQATLDGLRAVSSAVKGLPAFKLDENLAADVLKTAERRMLADAPLPTKSDIKKPATKMPAAKTPTTKKPAARKLSEPMWRTVARRFLTPRAIAWSTAITLVAIIFTFHNPEEDKPGPRGPIAMDMAADDDMAGDMTTHGPGEFRAAPSIESAPESIAKEELAAPARLAAKTAKRDISTPPAFKSPAAKPLVAASPPMESFDRSAMKSVPKKAEEKAMKKADAPKKSLADMARKPAAKGARVELEQQAEQGMGMGGPGMGGGMGGGMSGMSGRMGGPDMGMEMDKEGPGMGGPGMGGPGMGGPGMGMEMGKEGPMPLAEKDNRGQIRRKAGYNAPAAKRRPNGKSAYGGMSPADEPPTVTVSCHVDSRPTAQKALKQILLAQKLLPQPPPALNQPAQPPQAKQNKTKLAERDSIAIHLTPPQLEKVMAEIRKQPKIFGKCELLPAPTDTKLGFARENSSRQAMQQQAPTHPAQMPPPAIERTAKFKVVFLLQLKAGKN